MTVVGCALIVALVAGADRFPQDPVPRTPSPVMDSIANLVRQRHPELELLRARLKAAEARVAPSAAVGPAELSVEVEEVPDGARLWGAGQVRAGVERELFSGGKRSARRAHADAVAASLRARVFTAEQVVVAASRIRVVEWLAATAAAGRIAALDTLLGGTEESIVARLGTGDARYLDVLRIRAERLRLRAELRANAAAADEARLALIGWLAGDSAVARRGAELLEGLRADARSLLAPGALPMPPALEQIPTVSRLDQVTAALAAEGAAGIRLAQAESRRSLVGSGGLQRFPGAGDRGAVGLTLGARVTLPFTAAGQRRATIAAARVEEDALRTEGRLIRAEVLREVTVLLARYRAERARAQDEQLALIADLEREREAGLEAYRAGQLSLLELLDFERTLIRAELERLNAVRDAAITWEQLAAGGLTAIADHLGLGEIR